MMKIDYGYVFSGHSPNEKNACDLSFGYMRFLIALVSGYHTFYVDDEPVVLTDSERAIIDDGHARLMAMYVGENCASGGGVMVKVLDKLQTGGFMFAAGNISINWDVGQPDTNYLTRNGNAFVCQKAGIYHFNYHVNANPTTQPTTERQFIMTIQKNNVVQDAVSFNYIDDQKVAQCSSMMGMDVGDSVVFRLENRDGILTEFGDGLTFLQGWYLGEIG